MAGIAHNPPEETLREMLYRWAKARPLTLKRQAEHLGLAESTLGNSINPHIEAMEYKLAWLIPHMLLNDSLAPLDYLEACVGRVAFDLPQAPECVANLQAELARTIKEFGDVIAASGTALEDGRVQRNEVKRIEQEINEMVRQAFAFLQAVKDRMERY
ncbi:phage regulatory CII family protein [Syntrophotalea acetylenica]|uniref:Uncharacterized protein n=1 Tax=Syntrophotalea acetylenica TaxID=29542 RepID=A0A1L3GDP7_SYNAC|nr:phage regulatory CII family protein [Syntrophotalea acetylenica]APG24073.1 hypothetical protein A7E75_02795 [Syntrophotalea acetylenica]APG44655.1 hypothetical protein A6070_11420 [Syntrophotalea acetylenica]APG45455.1 hypothetical protein A6070_14845 [Syntrophotalea acetylenica]